MRKQSKIQGLTQAYMKAGLIALFALVGGWTGAVAQDRKESGSYFIVRATDKSPAEVIDALTAHIQAKKYIDFGIAKVKPPQGEITFVKFCMPAIGRQLFAVSLELSPMLPCGSITIYSKQGRTEVAALHPRYMQVLYPHPAVERAAKQAALLVMDAMESATR